MQNLFSKENKNIVWKRVLNYNTDKVVGSLKQGFKYKLEVLEKYHSDYKLLENSLKPATKQ